MRVFGLARWLKASSATSPSHVIPRNCLDASPRLWSAPSQVNIIDGPGPLAALFATSSEIGLRAGRFHVRSSRRGRRLVLCPPIPPRGCAMAKTAAAAPEEQHFVLSHLPPSLAQRRLALAVVLALLVAFVVTAGPLSTFQPGRIDAFIPAYATAIFVTDLLTAVLLFAQFSILRSHALLALASGYLYTALIVIPWMLTFPGVFTPGGLLGAGLQSTNWLYTLWHAGFPLFVIAYALLKDADPAKGLWQGPPGAAILSTVAVTGLVV